MNEAEIQNTPVKNDMLENAVKGDDNRYQENSVTNKTTESQEHEHNFVNVGGKEEGAKSHAKNRKWTQIPKAGPISSAKGSDLSGSIRKDREITQEGDDPMEMDAPSIIKKRVVEIATLEEQAGEDAYVKVPGPTPWALGEQ